jgi:hypothetical protein
MRAHPFSVASVAFSAFLKGCADQIAYAPPKKVWQAWQLRRSLRSAQIRLPMRATPPKCCRSLNFDTP